jgi:hypothetical protein
MHNHGTSWNERELKTVWRLYKDLTDSLLAERLGRSEEGIRHVRHLYGWLKSRPKRPYTRSDIALLNRLLRQGKDRLYIAIRMQRSLNSIHGIIWRTQSTRNTNCFWSEADLKFLTENHKMPRPKLAARLKREVWSIQNKLRELGLTADTRIFLTEEEKRRALALIAAGSSYRGTAKVLGKPVGCINSLMRRELARRKKQKMCADKRGLHDGDGRSDTGAGTEVGGLRSTKKAQDVSSYQPGRNAVA